MGPPGGYRGHVIWFLPDQKLEVDANSPERKSVVVWCTRVDHVTRESRGGQVFEEPVGRASPLSFVPFCNAQKGSALKNPTGVLYVRSDRCTVSAGRKVKMETPGRGNT